MKRRKCTFEHRQRPHEAAVLADRPKRVTNPDKPISALCLADSVVEPPAKLLLVILIMWLVRRSVGWTFQYRTQNTLLKNPASSWNVFRVQAYFHWIRWLSINLFSSSLDKINVVLLVCSGSRPLTVRLSQVFSFFNEDECCVPQLDKYQIFNK